MSNLKGDVCLNGRNWSITFVVSMNNLWRCRNELIFENMKKAPHEIVVVIKRQVDAIVVSANMYDELYLGVVNHKLGPVI